MPYDVMPLPFKPHRLDGLSDRLLESHYENNYGGALRRLNAIETRLAGLNWATATVFEINGRKREESVAVGSVILHEIYFDGLGGPGGDPPEGPLAAALARDFGSIAKWRAGFTAMGKAMAGGSGWVLLSWSDRLGRLVNQWTADHAHGLAGGVPVLALDMYEHAYRLDFGAKAGLYVDAFMKNLHWERIEARFRRAAAAMTSEGSATQDDGSAQLRVEELRDRLARGERLRVLDVRLGDDLARSDDRLPDSEWHDPERVDDWGEALPRDMPTVLYCMYGFWVSRDAAAALRRRGVDASSLAGGIAAWRAIGGPTVPLSAAQRQGEAA